MSKIFVEIEEKTMRNLETVAKSKGFETVEQLLESVANSISPRCSSNARKTGVCAA